MPPRFQFIGGSLAIDFVNTVGDRQVSRRDYFQSPNDVRTWAVQAHLVEAGRRVRDLTPADLRRVIAAREQIYALLYAVATRRPLPRRSLEWLNEMVGRIDRQRRLVPSAHGLAWNWGTNAPLADLVIGAAVRDLVRLLTDEQRPILSECVGSNCGWLFLDRSRGGRRKWCSMADCGNREKARRHYQRARTGDRRP
jgi:predicted RNA-binding Zn ribbon-like protein